MIATEHRQFSLVRLSIETQIILLFLPASFNPLFLSLSPGHRGSEQGSEGPVSQPQAPSATPRHTRRWNSTALSDTLCNRCCRPSCSEFVNPSAIDRLLMPPPVSLSVSYPLLQYTRVAIRLQHWFVVFPLLTQDICSTSPLSDPHRSSRRSRYVPPVDKYTSNERISMCLWQRSLQWLRDAGMIMFKPPLHPDQYICFFIGLTRPAASKNALAGRMSLSEKGEMS